jgi:Flp pilus assembly protein TadG
MAWLCRRIRRLRSQRGATALEAALVTPLLIVLVLGIIEFSLIMRDHAVVVSDSRTGARIASTGAGAGKGTCETGPLAPPCVTTDVPALAQLAADAIQRQGSAMPVSNIDYILVYKANSDGYPGAEGNKTMPTSCSGVSNCVMFKFRPNLTPPQFKYNSGSWPSNTINACFPSYTDSSGVVHPLDRVGVQLVAHHKMLTGFFGNSVTLTDHAVMDFEPLAAQICASGSHQ